MMMLSLHVSWAFSPGTDISRRGSYIQSLPRRSCSRQLVPSLSLSSNFEDFLGVQSTITIANNDNILSGYKIGAYFSFLSLLIIIPFVGGTMDTFRISAFRAKRQDFIDAIEAEIKDLEADGDAPALETAKELQVKLQDVYDEIEAERIEDKKNKYLGLNRYWMQLRNDPDADISANDIKADRGRYVPGMDGKGFVPGEMAREELKSQGNRYQRRQGKTGKRKKSKL